MASLWGVLISQVTATSSNGLLPYVDAQRSAVADPAPPSAPSSSGAPQQQLCQRVPPSLRQRFHWGGTGSSAEDRDAPACTVLLPLYGDSCRIGRLLRNDLALPSNLCVSNVHCILTVTAAPTRVALFDTSTNGCRVNGRVIGKGRACNLLRDGDTVALVDAGPRRTTAHNLSFTFYTLDGFDRLLAAMQADGDTTAAAAAAAAAPSARARQVDDDGGARARRLARLLRAQWDVAAQVERMYRHGVDEFYTFCPDTDAAILGVGGFGKVVRGALKAVEASSADAARSLLPSPVEVAAWRGEQCASCSSREVGEEDFEDCLAVQQRRAAYVAAMAREPPASVVAVQASADARAAQSVTGARSTPFNGEENSCCRRADAAAPYPFAVKVVQKRRRLLEELTDSSNSSSNGDDEEKETEVDGVGRRRQRTVAPSSSRHAPHPKPSGPPPPPPPPQQQQQQQRLLMSKDERALLRELLAVESQPDDYARRREHAWGSASAAAAAAAAKRHAAPSEAVALSCDAPADAGAFTQHEERTRSERAAARERLLARLPPAVRRQYERELQQLRRQQVEVNILLAARHRNVIRLYEVFDQPRQLSLVMEQAHGGDLWALLQPTRPHSPAEAEDGEGLYGGGPLPEFLVKVIVVQTLEAVQYLHSMGIVHRDLKLENLLLERPCRVPAVCALQMQSFASRLRAYAHARAPAQPQPAPHAAACSEKCAAVLREPEHSTHFLLNPLSLLHTVHIPRGLWPVVKVADFGLSWAAERRQHRHGGKASASMQQQQQRQQTDAYAMTTCCGTPAYAAPEVTNAAMRLSRAGYTAAVDLFSVGVIAFSLLTGRLPYPQRRHPHAPARGPYMDYGAPLRFTRCRHRREAWTASRTDGPSAEVTAAVVPPPLLQQELLPPLALADGFRVPVPAGPRSTAQSTAAAAGNSSSSSSSRKHPRADGDADERTQSSAQQREWRQHMDAMADRVVRIEQATRRSVASAGATAVTEGIFPAALHETLQAVEHYTSRRLAEGREVDLERFFYASVAHCAAPCVSNGQSTSADGAGGAESVALPEVSPMGQQFLLGLLQPNPAQRMTVWQALAHPWLRDCRAGVESLEDEDSSSSKSLEAGV